MILADTPSLGLLLGLPVALLAALTCLASGALVLRTRRNARSRFDREDHTIVGYGLLAVGAVALLATAVAMWPWKYDYHFWIDKQGRVENISKRLVSNGDKGMSERYVVTVAGTPYGVDDTRASLLKAGDTVKLRCKKEHQLMQPHESDGWACRWGGVTR